MSGTTYNTKSKKKTLEYLKENIHKTVTIDDVFNHLENTGNPVNITTVYRTLERLEKEGKLLKYMTDDGKKSSYKLIEKDSSCHEHIHLQCSDCGVIIHLDCECMDEIFSHISKEHNFIIKFSNTILYGQCKDCKSKFINKQ